jgi:hypothetical protein
MEIIQNSPYRILGVYANSPTKERLANHNRMKAFLKVGKSVSFPLDLTKYISDIHRSDSMVAEANAKLTLPKDQMLYAQFWFIKLTPLDDVAFNHLIAGEIDKAEEIWQKRDCLSSLQNRITSALIRGDYSCAISCADLLYGNEQYVKQFEESVVGVGNLDYLSLAFSFLDLLCEEVGADKLLSFTTNDEWKNHIRGKVTKPLIDCIQDAIYLSQKSKGKAASARLEAGKNLIGATKEALTSLKNVLPMSDVQYQIIADKLAKEILQCGIDYFNNADDDDAPSTAMPLQKYALSIAASSSMKEKCRENVEKLSKVGREYVVRNELERLTNNIKKLRGETFWVVGISNVNEVVTECIPDIESIRQKLGNSSDELYIKIASAVVSAAVNVIVKIVNAYSREGYISLLSEDDIKILHSTLSSAIDTMKLMRTIDMDYKTRNYYENQRSQLRKLYLETRESSSKGCLIAVAIWIILGVGIGAILASDGGDFVAGFFISMFVALAVYAIRDFK